MRTKISVSKVTDYGAPDWGSISGRDFSLRQTVLAGSAAHTTSYQMDTSGHSPGVKWAQREDDQTSPLCAEIKNAWSFTSALLYIFIQCCLSAGTLPLLSNFIAAL
jgi:hypothetical protein